jgi:hypothetical protein
VRLVELLVGRVEPGTTINLADALVAPNVLRPHLTNWTDVVRYFVRSVEVDAAADGTSQTATLLERLLSYEDVRATMSQAPTLDGNAHAFANGQMQLARFATPMRRTCKHVWTRFV